MLSGSQDASTLVIPACHLSPSLCVQLPHLYRDLVCCRVSCLASGIIIILIIILMSSGQLMIKRAISSPAPRIPGLWLMCSLQSWVSTVLRKRDFIHRANPISVVLTLQKLTQIFQLICGLDIWVTIKLPLCPSLWSPAVPCRRLQHAVIFSSVVTCNFLQQFIAQIAAVGKKLNMYTYWATFYLLVKSTTIFYVNWHDRELSQIYLSMC